MRATLAATGMRRESSSSRPQSSAPSVPSTAVRIEGVRPVLEALAAGRRRLWRVVLPQSSASSRIRELRERLEAEGVPLSAQPGADVFAWADPFPEEPFERLITEQPCELLVALDRVTDVGNLGSISRSAETAGFQGLVLEHRRAPAIQPGVLRASAGALERLRVGRTPNLRRALQLLAREGFRVLVAVPGASELGALESAAWSGSLVWVFGNEERGVRSSIRDVADVAVGIPLRGGVQSLGVAAAAAFLLHRTAELRGGGVPLGGASDRE